MPNKVTRIEMRGFRGATLPVTVDLTTQKPAVLLFGENGSGKSTLIDAIDAVCNGSAGSVRERASTTVKEHLHSLHSNPDHLRVEIDFGGSAWQSTVVGGKIVRSPDTPPPPAAILRRGRLLKLVEAAPAERYTELRRLIGVENVEAGEKALGEALRDTRKEYDRVTGTLTASQTSLTSLWEAEGRPETDALVWAEKVAAVKPVEAEAKIAILQGLLQTAKDFEAARSGATTAQRERIRARTAVEEAQSALEAAEAVGAHGGAALAQLLEHVERYLAGSTNADACPVCEQAVDADMLRTAVRSRLDGMQALTNALSSVQAAKTRLKAADEAVARASDKESSARAAIVREYVAAGEVEEGATPDACMALRGRLQQDVDDLQKDINQRNAVRQYRDQIRTTSERAKDLQTMTQRLAAAHDRLRAERHAFTNGLLNDLRNRVNELYAAIHPDEGLALSKLALSANSSASVEQGATFAGANQVVPQAYFSEAHLDTLGFCIWLAVQERTYDGKCIVVLDDVFTSVDMAHLDRIIDVLITVTERFDQLVVTTHSRHWRDRHRRGLAEKTVEVFELGTWSPDGGIRVIRGKTARQDLAARLAENPLPRQAAASAAGVLMEDVLEGLAVRHGSSMPRNSSNLYELKPLLDGTKRLAKNLVVERLGRPEDGGQIEERVEMKTLHERVGELYEVRNQVGAHANAASEEIPDAKVRDFCKRVAAFADALHCKECGEVPSKEEAGFRHCRCRRTRLSPVRA